MPGSCSIRVAAMLIGACSLAVAGSARAQTPVEHSSEARFQLDVKVNDTALAARRSRGI